jgi:hypothetical protein
LTSYYTIDMSYAEHRAKPRETVSSSNAPESPPIHASLALWNPAITVMWTGY